MAVGIESTYTAQGVDQYYVVPDHVSAIFVRIWGAGGGEAGGSGAFVRGVLLVVPGETLKIMVGCSSGGGFQQTPLSYGGGGRGRGVSDMLCGPGGGGSFIVRASTYLAVAGGGGGGTYLTIGDLTLRGGGAGGILVGGNDLSGGEALGGTQTAGGAPNGLQFQGGNAVATTGGGGGGGYFGGGGGNDYSFTTSFPGAGGSSFIDNLQNPYYEAGQPGSAATTLPGGISDTFYQTGVGTGGPVIDGQGHKSAGGGGLVVIEPLFTPLPINPGHPKSPVVKAGPVTGSK